MSEWISVKDRLPKLKKERPGIDQQSDSVLVTDGQHIEVGIRWKTGHIEHFLPNYRENFEKVTHWMPLPKPPE